MTAVTKGAAGKRDKFRKSVSRCGVSIYGPKHSAAASASSDATAREKIFIEDPRAPCLNIDYSSDAYRLLPSFWVPSASAAASTASAWGTSSALAAWGSSSRRLTQAA
uniref:Uncharacterized protein n=1 Tax=Hyaloperonospora arabidopsidis (strain Emoy2) TaxID=559515 RepID=M4B5U8_HYAAE